MRAMLHGQRLVFLIVGAVLMLGAGAAYATIPDGGGVIHGCYVNGVGVLRVIDASKTHCSKFETEIAWNQSGQSGPPGQTGPAGPSDGWDAQGVGTIPTGGADVVLPGAATLASGSYLISGSATWAPLDSGNASLLCTLLASGTDVTGNVLGGFGTASTAGGGTVTTTGAITVASGTASLTLSCRELSGTTSVGVMGRAHAIKVGTLHSTP